MQPPKPYIESAGAIDEDRLARIHRLIDACLERRSRGDAVSPEALVHDHPDLMPELADELRHLEVIERARQRAAGSSQLGPLTASLPDGLVLGSDVFPGYDLIAEVHRGGQGVVYRAVQRSTHRTVALKVLREGVFAGARELARFEREVEILAELDHPNIVRIYDRGVTAGGSFYYVMDYIDGLAADAHVQHAAAGGPPPVPEVLTLFLAICDAVHAAHLHGVIHRDIKPSNIRVDREGRPFVLDFGLAKLAKLAESDDARAELAMETVTGQFVGSVPWASPEQAAGATDIDLRTDVYALGLLLFHLLTRRFPYDVEGPAGAVLERIRTIAPLRPSLIRRDVSDELETIILRCLAKERERRYESAGALAQDLRRMRAGEPIDAKRDSTGYLLRKSLWRHRVATGVVAGFLIVIVASAIWLVQLYAGQREQRLRAEASAAEAQREAERASAISSLLKTAISAADPSEARGRDYTVRELLDDFDASLPAENITDPDVLGSVQLALGEAYRGLGLVQEAHQHFASALQLARQTHKGPHHNLATSLNQYALSLSDLGSNGAALPLQREALAMFRELYGSGHETTMDAASNVATVLHRLGRYDEAEPVWNDLVARARTVGPSGRKSLAVYLHNLATLKDMLGAREEALTLAEESLAILQDLHPAPHPAVANAMASVAEISLALGQITEARERMRAALAMRREFFGENHAAVAGTYSDLASAAMAGGDLDAALANSLKALAIWRELYPGAHPSTLNGLNSLAQVYIRREEIDAAAPVVEEMITMGAQVFGGNHYNVVAMHNTLAQLRLKQGRYSDAEAEFTTALEMLKTLFGDRHPTIPVLLNNLGMCHSMNDEDATALRYYREALALAREVYPADHPEIGAFMTHVAEALKFTGDFEAALPQYEEALAFRRRVLGPQHISVGYTLNGLGDLYLEMRDFPAALPIYREALDVSTHGLPLGHVNRAVPMINLGRALVELDRCAEAEAYLRQGLEIRRNAGASPDRIGEAEHWLGACLNGLGQYAEAEPLLADALRIRNDDPNERAWRRADTQAHWARALAARGDVDRAEERMLAAFELASADAQCHPALTARIARDLVDLYAAAGDASQAEHWSTMAASVLSRQSSARVPRHDE